MMLCSTVQYDTVSTIDHSMIHSCTLGYSVIQYNKAQYDVVLYGTYHI